MTYPETIKYLESFANYEKISFWHYRKSFELKRIRDFLAAINNPQDALRCIHVAGSKGKGSTCAFIAYILRAAGFKVGLYTSPHLSDFRERIRILIPITDGSATLAIGTKRSRSADNRKPKTEFEGMIPRKSFVELVEKLKPMITQYNKISKYGALSFFEICTALAFVYFKEKKTDFVVLETGLGGRLDATNTVNSLVYVITPISYEHTDKLGSTLRKIAGEKAMIIKRSLRPQAESRPPIVITAPQEKEALRVIRQRCKEAGAKLFQINKEINYEKTKNGFKVTGLLGKYANLKIRLLGAHQLINASAAIGAVEALRFSEKNINPDSIKKGLYGAVWPGRCEAISKNPSIVLDGAQNAASFRVLRETIKKDFKYKRLILVLGISNDKDISGIWKEIRFLPDQVILTKSNNPRAAETSDIERIIRPQASGLRPQVIKTKSVKEAVRIAMGMARKEDLILVTGSLFVVGEARKLKCMI